jgi:hypothetical protein
MVEVCVCKNQGSLLELFINRTSLTSVFISVHSALLSSWYIKDWALVCVCQQPWMLATITLVTVFMFATYVVHGFIRWDVSSTVEMYVYLIDCTLLFILKYCIHWGGQGPPMAVELMLIMMMMIAYITNTTVLQMNKEFWTDYYYYGHNLLFMKCWEEINTGTGIVSDCM